MGGTHTWQRAFVRNGNLEDGEEECLEESSASDEQSIKEASSQSLMQEADKEGRRWRSLEGAGGTRKGNNEVVTGERCSWIGGHKRELSQRSGSGSASSAPPTFVVCS